MVHYMVVLLGILLLFLPSNCCIWMTYDKMIPLYARVEQTMFSKMSNFLFDMYFAWAWFIWFRIIFKASTIYVFLTVSFLSLEVICSLPFFRSLKNMDYLASCSHY